MRASKGVIASAIVAIIGSLVSILFGVMMMVTMRAAPVTGIPLRPFLSV
jgi:hypothetical protein